MKKMFVLLAMFCLCFQTIAVYATTPDFSGVWELDVSRSTLPDTMRIETMTLKVRQMEKSLQYASFAKTSQKTDAGTKSKGGFLTQTASFNLGGDAANSVDGDETTPREKASVTADGRLNLTIVRNFQNEMGDFTMKTNEIWELMDGGNTLKITRYTETPRGATNAEMFFTRTTSVHGARVANEGGDTDVIEYKGPVSIENKGVGPVSVENRNLAPPKKISGGVLNGKATSFPKPEYPAAARAVNASGAVNVQVTIDEQGDVVSASAVSGHPLLRQASEQAARGAKFAPILLSGVPVKVTGVLVYNFTP